MIATKNPHGKVGRSMAECFAYLNSPAAIAGEIAALERAMRAGDRSEETLTLLADWRSIQLAQRKLLAKEGVGT